MSKDIRTLSNRVGTRFITEAKIRYTVIEYNIANDIKIQFEDGTVVKTTWANAANGLVKNPNKNNNNKILYNIGYIGIGKYNIFDHKKYYIIWKNMFNRCYLNSYIEEHETYELCVVDEKWHSFQNFCEWCEINYIESFELDKDILLKNNKIYSEKTCCFVPEEINKLFCKSNKRRGKYPIGVCFDIERQKFMSKLGKIHLGRYDSSEEAFQVYKIGKEKLIKIYAEKWKLRISDKCFQAMINYKVEITD